MTSTLTKLQAKRAEQKQNGQKGFTLVELAIVLVIIGLIVGGVLVGQDLIRAAEIRATITDIESYNAAANTFRTKYNGYPGDLLSNRAIQFGFVSGDGSDGLGDGDGVLENGGVAANKAGVGGETQAFWEHLSAAGYIKQGFNSLFTGNAGGDAATRAGDLIADPGVTAPNLPLVLPASRSRETTFMHAHSFAGRNFYLMANMGAVADAGGDSTTAAGLTVSEALNFDEKLDDGDPLGGTVVAVDSVGLTNAANGLIEPGINAMFAVPAPAAIGVCVESAQNGYNAATEDFLNAVACQIRIRASF